MNNVITTENIVDINTIKHQYNEIRKLAIEYVQQEALKILQQHIDLDEFVMAMGTWLFTQKNVNKYSKSTVIYDRPEYMKSLEKFISEWDRVFYLTGESMRFNSSGIITTDW